MIAILVTTNLGRAPALAANTTANGSQAEPSAPTQGDLLVYGDTLSPGWENWSWNSSIVYDNAAPTLSGPGSIAVTFQAAYAGFSVRTSPALNAADFHAVSFFVFAPDTDRSLTLVLQSSDDGGLSQSFDFNAPAGEWSQIVVGLDSLGNPGAIARINIGDNSGAPQAVFYLDQISLLGVGGSTPTDIPAVIPGAQRPTLDLSTGHGYAGQSVSVSGQGPAGLGSPKVRLAWLFDGATFTAGEAALSPANAYTGRLEIPLGAPEGPARLCAALAGLAQAVFTCKDFVIDPPPAARVSGQLAAALVAPGKAAQVQLLNFAGDVVHTAPVSSTGSFVLGSVKPGLYRYTVVGELLAPAARGALRVNPGLDTNFPIGRHAPGTFRDPVTNQFCDPANSQASIAGIIARYTDRGFGFTLALPAAGGGADSDAESDADSPAAARTAGFKSPLGNAFALKSVTDVHNRLFRDDMGTFLSGVALNNTFRANVQQINGTLERVEFHILLPNGSLVSLGADSQAPYEAAYNVGLLPPGKSKLLAAAVVNGQRQCPFVREIAVAANPLASPHFQPGRSVVWKTTGPDAGHYTFDGTLPNLGNTLPLAFPASPTVIPYLGNIQSKLAAGLRLTGEIHLNGMIRLQAVNANAQAILLGRQLYNSSKTINTGKAAYFGGIDPDGLRNLRIATGRQQLWRDSYHQDIFNGILFSFLGMVNVGMTVKIGMSGEVILNAVIYPFQPALDLTLTPAIGVYLTVSVWVNILVLASAGADAIPSVHVALPLRINTNDSRRVWFDDPCFGINVDLKVWVKVNYIFDTWRKEKTFNVLREDEPNGCIFGRAAQQLLQQARINAQLAPPNPRVMAAPALATNAQGAVLSVYVEDLTPTAELPTPVVMARFKDPDTGDWLPAVQVSSGQRAVNDPVATFFGLRGRHALVAWTQTELTPEEENPDEEALPQYLNRLEIYWAAVLLCGAGLRPGRAGFPVQQ